MYYVDKSLLIKDLLESGPRGVYLYTRPRRFGKTTNLSMLDAFFNMEYEGNDWFDGLKISDYPKFEQYENAYPVIFLNLKGTKSPDYEQFLKSMNSAVLDVLRRHRYLFGYDGLLKDEEFLLDSLSMRTADREMLKTSIDIISGIVERYHGKKVVLLIDEYDRSVSDSFGKESHRPIMDFLGEFMNSSIKNNPSIQLAYITGVMQIAKESIFSDLNNIIVNDIFSTKSDERFGFTESEVKTILSDYQNPGKFDEVKQWFDGYRFGNAEVYNPYSVMNYVWNDFTPMPYWANSGGDVVIRWLLERIDGSNFSDILGLVKGGTVTVELNASLRYEALNSDDTSIYSIMAMSGYLNATPAGDGRFDVSIPNKEIGALTERLLNELNPISNGLFTEFIHSVLEGDTYKVTELFQKILMSGSYLNLNAENAYGLILMTILNALADRYHIKTEYEAGNGRTDIMMIPRVGNAVPMIFELKKVDSENRLAEGLDEAMRQIHDRRYYMGMKGRVVLVAMSFFGKIPMTRIDTIDCRRMRLMARPRHYGFRDGPPPAMVFL